MHQRDFYFEESETHSNSNQLQYISQILMFSSSRDLVLFFNERQAKCSIQMIQKSRLTPEPLWPSNVPRFAPSKTNRAPRPETESLECFRPILHSQRLSQTTIRDPDRCENIPQPC